MFTLRSLMYDVWQGLDNNFNTVEKYSIFIKNIIKLSMDDLIKVLYNRLYNSDYDNNTTLLNLIDLVSAKSDDSINFYPGKPGISCCEQAYFVSLSSGASSKLRLEKSQFISLEKMLQIMFKHIFIDCLETTSNVVMICDEINTSIFNEYAAQFRALRTLNINLEVWYFKQAGPVNITDIV